MAAGNPEMLKKNAGKQCILLMDLARDHLWAGLEVSMKSDSKPGKRCGSQCLGLFVCPSMEVVFPAFLAFKTHAFPISRPPRPLSISKGCGPNCSCTAPPGLGGSMALTRLRSSRPSSVSSQVT